jgi:hypothetical protein
MKGAMEKESKIVNKEDVWPELYSDQWEETSDMLHLWMQMVGKIKLEFSPFMNHWWNISFIPSASGLTTSIIPYKSSWFEMEFNFVVHTLFIRTADGREDFIKLRSGNIAGFYDELKSKLKSLGIEIHIWTVPVEMEDRLPFDKDYRERKYDPDYAGRFWRCLVQVSKVLHIFRCGFRGKASPVHFFWGAMDLALTFFSGKPAPEHPGVPYVGRQVMIEAYNAELASFGFWGGKGLGEPAFYSYTYAEPENYKDSFVKPEEAYYNHTFREFILPYAAVRKARFPENFIMEFFTSSLQAAMNTGNWDMSLYCKEDGITGLYGGKSRKPVIDF